MVASVDETVTRHGTAAQSISCADDDAALAVAAESAGLPAFTCVDAAWFAHPNPVDCTTPMAINLGLVKNCPSKCVPACHNALGNFSFAVCGTTPLCTARSADFIISSEYFLHTSPPPTH